MANLDYKHILRKHSFPECAKEALPIIEKLICGRNAPSTKQIDLAMELGAEFLFCETDNKGHFLDVSLRDQSVKEMQLIFALANYFKDSGDETIKNTVFLSLFGETMGNKRAQTLWKLVSLAISYGYSSLLLAVGTWMQQLGCTSSHSLDLCRYLIKDFFKSTEQKATLLKLGQLAPRFTANFMTGVAEHYLKLDSKKGFVSPPPMLLEIITEWITEDSSLCMAAHQTQAALPSGGIAMAAITPFAGLFKWCILAPLATTTTEYEQVKYLYSRLYLGLLKNLLEVKPSPGPPTAMSAQHLAQVVPSILEYINKKQNEIANQSMKLETAQQQLNFQQQFNKGQRLSPFKDEYSEISTLDKMKIDQEFTAIQGFLDKRLDTIFGPNAKPYIKNENEFDMVIDEDNSDDNIIILEDIPNANLNLNEDRNAHVRFRELFFKKYQFMLDEINERLDNKYNKIYEGERMIVDIKTEMNKEGPSMQDILLDVALDRLAEAVQVSIAVKCMYGSKPYLFSQMENLPPNPMLSLILRSLKAQTL